MRAVGIIDDDAAIRDSLRFLLVARGIEPHCFASAADFLGSADVDQLGGLLIDQHMPDMSGIELIELLRSRRIVTPAIMLTGGTDLLLENRARKAGVLAILNKPVSGCDLMNWISIALAEGVTRAGARSK